MSLSSHLCQSRKKQLFIQAFAREEQQGIRDLARTPLLLSMLCLAFDETMHFPQRRAELYEEALDALLKKWDSSRSIQRTNPYGNLSLGHKRQLLMELAAESFQDKRIFLPYAWLTERITAFMRRLPDMQTAAIDSEAILRSIEAQHGLLIERAQKIYSFSHLTFQEYFAARYIVAQAKKEHYRYMTEQAHDDRWREVLLLTASMLEHSQAERFFLTWTDALQQLALSDQRITNFFAWAQTWSNPQQHEISYREPVSIVIITISALDRALARDRDLARALALDRALARDRDRDRTRALVLALARTRALDHDLARALALARDLARDLNSYLDNPERMQAEFSFWLKILTYLDSMPLLDSNAQRELIAAVRKSIQGLMKLPKEAAFIQTLPVLPTSTNTESWKHYARQLRTLLISKRNFGHPWQFDEQQLETLNKYLTSALHLVECLKLASIEDREAVLNRLFVVPISDATPSAPPKWWEFWK